MGHHLISFEEQCKSCNGTGLYIGIAEMDGSAVICHTCKGTGCHKIEISYHDFEGRKKRHDIKRVFQASCGIIIGGPNLEDFGGMPYQNWDSGNKFPSKSENRKYTCPAWWYQTIDFDKKPDWEQCILGGTFSNCKLFPVKNKCWDKWDKEFGGKSK